MKIIILSACLFLLFILQGHAQVDAEKSKLDSAVRSTVKSYLTNESYTRIPYRDFDEEINRKIEEDIGKRWNSMIGWLVGIGGVVIVILFNTLISKTKEATIKDVKEGLTEKISHIYLTTVKDQYEKQISDLEKIFRTKIAELDEKMKDLDSQTLMTKGNLIQNEIYKMREKKGYTVDQFNQLKGYLPQIEKMNDNRLLSDIINDLSYAAYYTKRENELLPVFDKYMEKPEIDIKENSYINIASGMFYNYASSKDTENKKKALKYINKSLEKVSDYGEALGLKLEFLMVDLEKTRNEEEKANIRQEAMMIFDQTLSSQYASKEAFSRFERVSTNATEKKYIDILRKEFKTEIEKLEEASKKQTQAGSKPESLN